MKSHRPAVLRSTGPGLQREVLRTSAPLRRGLPALTRSWRAWQLEIALRPSLVSFSLTSLLPALRKRTAFSRVNARYRVLSKVLD